MAILPITSAPHHEQPIDIEAWTEQATVAMNAVTISVPESISPQNPSVSLHIPLDDYSPPQVVRPGASATAQGGAARDGYYYKRKERMLRRDSLKHREALLKGREGSRRRQRWENDHLLHIPSVQPPEPHDWEIHPTYPVRRVPYYLAPLWDAGLSKNAERKAKEKKALKAKAHMASDPSHGTVSKELREKLKKARGAKGLLMDLENEVRRFVEEWEQKEREAEREGVPLELDSEDEEIVFVGRNGKMSDLQRPGSSGGVQKERMLFDSLEGDRSASFGRWLLHHIGTYYGLRTWSVTVGNPARREAYVGLKEGKLKSGRHPGAVLNPLPRPLWVMV